MKDRIDILYMRDLYNRFKKIPPGSMVEIEIDRLGAKNGRWDIPKEFRELFNEFSIRIESAEIINRADDQRKFTFMMYKMGGEPGITYIF